MAILQLPDDIVDPGSCIFIKSSVIDRIDPDYVNVIRFEQNVSFGLWRIK